MKNFRSTGATIHLTSAGAKKSGTLYFAGELAGIAGHDAESNQPVVLHLIGEYDQPKATGQAWAIGVKLYWDATNSVLTTADASGANKLAGHAGAPALTADPIGLLRLSN